MGAVGRGSGGAEDVAVILADDAFNSDFQVPVFHGVYGCSCCFASVNSLENTCGPSRGLR